jgi:hypothetical protein
MTTLDKLFEILSKQIKKHGTMPKKHVLPNKIADNNQSISSGAINEKPAIPLRSSSITKSVD